MCGERREKLKNKGGVMRWLKNNIAILILAASIFVHALAVMHTPTNAGYNDVQKVKIVDQWTPLPVRVVK